eukprot:scaffold258950_cov27-Tisochrysis_lutea.AAC.1
MLDQQPTGLRLGTCSKLPSQQDAGPAQTSLGLSKQPVTTVIPRAACALARSPNCAVGSHHSHVSYTGACTGGLDVPQGSGGAASGAYAADSHARMQGLGHSQVYYPVACAGDLEGPQGSGGAVGGAGPAPAVVVPGQLQGQQHHHAQQ